MNENEIHRNCTKEKREKVAWGGKRFTESCKLSMTHLMNIVE